MTALADVELHQWLVEAAAPLGEVLVAALLRSGPVSLPDSSDGGGNYGDGQFAQQLCRAVAGQQLSVTAAKTIWARVLAGVGDKPLTDYLLTTDPAELRAFGLSGNKAKAMRSIAEADTASRINEAELITMNAVERAERFTPYRSYLALQMWQITDAKLF